LKKTIDNGKSIFYETLNIKDNVEIWDEVIYQGPEKQTETPTKMRHGK
jgi:hypothetical protein